jgi:hypothetical protein
MHGLNSPYTTQNSINILELGAVGEKLYGLLEQMAHTIIRSNPKDRRIKCSTTVPHFITTSFLLVIPLFFINLPVRRIVEACVDGVTLIDTG